MPKMSKKNGSSGVTDAPCIRTDPTVRLSLSPDGSKSTGTYGITLAPTHEGQGKLRGELPALLVSFFYLERFLKSRHRYHYRDWVMDSGAFSAHNSGAEIDLGAYIACCKELMATDPTLTEIYSLDVVGDWQASLRNTETMWAERIPAIPCFHYGEPWEALMHLAKSYPKVAIGGCVGKGDKDKFANQCFARVWPKKLHGFGFGSEKSLMLCPWHSVDATNWEIGACKYGKWKVFGGQRVSVRGTQQNLRAEVAWYLELERKARVRWKKEMQILEQSEPTEALRCPTVRLVIDASAAGGRRVENALAPTIRLVSSREGTNATARRLARAIGDEDENHPSQKLIANPRNQVGSLSRQKKRR